MGRTYIVWDDIEGIRVERRHRRGRQRDGWGNGNGADGVDRWWWTEGESEEVASGRLTKPLAERQVTN
jgi:hypothetical protein